MLLLGSHLRIQNDLAYARLIRQEHHETVDTHSKAAVRRHTIFHRPEVVLIKRMPLFIIRPVKLRHLDESLLLIDRMARKAAPSR